MVIDMCCSIIFKWRHKPVNCRILMCSTFFIVIIRFLIWIVLCCSGIFYHDWILLFVILAVLFTWHTIIAYLIFRFQLTALAVVFTCVLKITQNWLLSLYGCETWTLKKAEERQLLVLRWQPLRKILGIHIIDKMRNEHIGMALNVSDTIVQKVHERQHRWLGLVLWMDENRIASTVLHGRMERTPKRGGRGRQRTTWLNQHWQNMKWNHKYWWKSQKTEINGVQCLRMPVLCWCASFALRYGKKKKQALSLMFN